MNNLQIFATGGTGTIGRHFPPQVRRLPVRLQQEFDIGTFVADCDQFDLIHAAGIVGPAAVSADLAQAELINVHATATLAKQALRHGVKHFVYVSTGHVYEPTKDPISESSKLKPLNVYAEQKLEAEEVLQDLFRKNPEKLSILRVFSVLGWDMPPFTLGGAVSSLILEERTELRNGLDVRTFLTPRQIALAIYEFAQHAPGGQIYNLSSRNALTIKDAVTQMLEVANKKLFATRVVAEKSLNPAIIGNSSKLLQLIPTLQLDWNAQKDA